MIDLNALFDELFPLTRSITGDGYRASIDVFKRHMDLKVHRYETGRQVFDWTVPKEWSISEARLTGPDGETICDLKDSNLHVVNYSVPVDADLTLDELTPHLHSIPGQPSLIPYVTSYYKEAWGFCLPHERRAKLKPGRYHALIRSALRDGFVEVADATLPGTSKRTVLISSYLCHPSLANNELSGPLVLLTLYKKLQAFEQRRFTYRFVLNPETIGSICYLSTHGDALMASMQAGLVLTCLGGTTEKLSYKLSRRGDGSLDRLCHFLGGQGQIGLREFNPCEGSDERQYCSPGFNLPVGQFARTVYGQYPEYHTSGDDKALMRIERLQQSADDIFEMLLLHERMGAIARHEPHCEIQLGKRGLYPNVNSSQTRQLSNDALSDNRRQLEAILWLLNLADGQHDIVDVATKSRLPMALVAQAFDRLAAEKLIYLKD